MAYTVRLDAEDDWEGWREAARSLVAQGIPPENVSWQVGDAAADLFGGAMLKPARSPAFSVSKDFLYIASRAILHRDPERFSLLHGLLLRVLDNPAVLRDRSDRRTRRAEQLYQTIRRDMHKMRAFVRFRVLHDADGERYVAWFEPEHHIVRANAEFFLRRFNKMRWSILTPEISIHWDGKVVTEGPGASRFDVPGDDPVEQVWTKYYTSTFNPSRLKTNAMIKEMPIKYWKNLPEAREISGLIAGARKRELEMIDVASKAPDRPRAVSTVALLRDEARDCRRCMLCKPATQTVFGEGDPGADIMFVGEQPGDQEDLSGRPFVGPAGAVFDRALKEAGIDRSRVYVTNAVKHFKFEPRGKRRIHARPNIGEIDACRWWLDQERALVRPKIIIAMGATAIRSLTGRTLAIEDVRGTLGSLNDGVAYMATIHPSYVLRISDTNNSKAEFSRFVEDIKAGLISVSQMS